MSNKKLKKSFYMQETTKVATDLLGCFLVRTLKNGTQLRGQIIETEAYLGKRDASCHSFQGRRTPRTETMYLEGGHAYIYFTYGMHFCFNVVTSQKDKPEAVLIRAVEPIEGILIIKKNRKNANFYNLTNGPAKLCQAFKIDKKLNGKSLLENSLYIEQKEKKIPCNHIIVTERIGLSPSSIACHWPLRFYLKNINLYLKK